MKLLIIALGAAMATGCIEAGAATTHRDSIVEVQPKMVTVVLRGEVNFTGQVSLAAGFHLSDAIRAAGGFTEWARKGTSVLVRGMSGKNIRLNMRRVKAGGQHDPIMEQGDIVYVGRIVHVYP